MRRSLSFVTRDTVSDQSAVQHPVLLLRNPWRLFSHFVAGLTRIQHRGLNSCESSRVWLRFLSFVGLLAWFLVLICCASADLARAESPAQRQPEVVGGIQVSADVLNLMLGRQIASTTPVREQVMNALTVGNADTTADISFGLQPNQGQAVLDVRLRGRSEVNDSVAYRGRVRVYSTSTTTIDASKQLVLGNTGLTVRPASANCRTSVQILDVDANRRFVERIGWRRANRLRPQAAGLTSQRVSRRVETQLDREINTAVEEARSSMEVDLGEIVADGDLLAGHVAFSTTERHARVHILRGEQSHRPAPSRTQTLQDSLDIQLIAHKSLIESLLEHWLGDRELHDRAFLEWMKLLTGSEPHALWVHSRRPPWSVTFAAQPVTVSFADGVAGATLHVSSASHGDERRDGPFDIAVAYRLEISPDGPHLVRVHGPTITHRESGASTEQREAFATFLRHKFDAVFPPELFFDGLQPPAGGSWGKLRRYLLMQLIAEDGWFAIGYRDEDRS